MSIISKKAVKAYVRFFFIIVSLTFCIKTETYLNFKSLFSSVTFHLMSRKFQKFQIVLILFETEICSESPDNYATPRIKQNKIQRENETEKNVRRIMHAYKRNFIFPPLRVISKSHAYTAGNLFLCTFSQLWQRLTNAPRKKALRMSEKSDEKIYRYKIQRMNTVDTPLLATRTAYATKSKTLKKQPLLLKINSKENHQRSYNNEKNNVFQTARFAF